MDTEKVITVNGSSADLGTYEKVYGLEDIDAKNDVSDE